MIRKSKNNEDKPDFKEMWSEVNKNIQEQDAEQDIISRVPYWRLPSMCISTGFNKTRRPISEQAWRHQS